MAARNQAELLMKLDGHRRDSLELQIYSRLIHPSDAGDLALGG